MQNVYECMFIFDSNSFARDPKGVSGKIPAMVEKCGGQILASRLWNEQKLAYPIKGRRKGTYWLSYFRMDSSKVAEFNRACQLNDTILRNLTLKVEPRLEHALVAHARGESPVPEEEAPPESAGAEQAKGTDEEIPAEEAVAAMDGSVAEDDGAVPDDEAEHDEQD